MGERYYLTGVQLGMLKAFLKLQEIDEAMEVIDNVLENQFLGNISNAKPDMSDWYNCDVKNVTREKVEKVN